MKCVLYIKFCLQQSPQLFQSLQPKADNSKESLLSTWSNASDKIDRHHEQQQLLNLETGVNIKQQQFTLLLPITNSFGLTLDCPGGWIVGSS